MVLIARALSACAPLSFRAKRQSPFSQITVDVTACMAPLAELLVARVIVTKSLLQKSNR
jgi:hypothetical protein